MLEVKVKKARSSTPTPADYRRLAYCHGGTTKPRGQDNWIVPAIYLEAARRVMGTLDADVSDLEVPWPADARHVWMRPRNGRGNVAKAVTRFLDHLDTVDSAIVLTNNASDTAWWHDLADQSAVLCLVWGRIKFELPDGSPAGSNTTGQHFHYFGPDREAFRREFSSFGGCCVQHRRTA
jgi:hypothetical protein